jgi:hypothetical protein
VIQAGFYLGINRSSIWVLNEKQEFAKEVGLGEDFKSSEVQKQKGGMFWEQQDQAWSAGLESGRAETGSRLGIVERTIGCEGRVLQGVQATH